MPYTRKNNTRNSKHRKPKKNLFQKRLSKEFYESFTYDSYLAQMTSNPKLFSNLFMMKLRSGFPPSQNILKRVMESKNPDMQPVRNFIEYNRMQFKN
ncbi:hypothetical protein crov536 [Cafeteria roenbergensis virus]|uniref:Uncharacterized protein n=1 Tax=Cafeteria roenbergensis virus (strain BV-PW1) TaxID=693272 RepID=E3T5V7_CROVB|nr:hypothetical protein crov536 [Cafeteria roenbergensis virus BV-PW1]ADO67570.1 hypothetical protein crov536 [Cafeteria roenbergensis virus BV-PW1]